MRKVANILLIIYVVICGLILFGLVFSSSEPVYFKDMLEAFGIFIVLFTPGLFIYTIVRLLSIMDPVDKLTIHKFAIILLAIYFLICAALSYLNLAFGTVKDSLIMFIILLMLGISIYTMLYLLYDIYKQFALWKIVNIVFLTVFLYIMYMFL